MNDYNTITTTFQDDPDGCSRALPTEKRFNRFCGPVLKDLAMFPHGNFGRLQQGSKAETAVSCIKTSQVR